MTNIYITGDRSINPLDAVAIVAQSVSRLLEQHGPDMKIVTGDAPTGIERAVRYWVPDEHQSVVTRVVTDGKPDFDEHHNRVKSQVESVVILHNDPLSSNITASAMRVFSPEQIQLPLTEG